MPARSESTAVAAVIPTVVATVASPVAASTYAVGNDGRGADRRGGPGDGCADDTSAHGSCWS